MKFNAYLSSVEFVDNEHDAAATLANQQTRSRSKRNTKESTATAEINFDTEYMSEPEQDHEDQILDILSGEDIHQDLELTTTHADIPQFSPLQSHSACVEQISLSQASRRSRNNFLESPSLIYNTSPSFKASWPCQTQHEARLFHYYIKVMAPWVSTT